jgi:hypothetical protein
VSTVNKRFTVVPFKENTNGVKKNGTWNGLIGQIVREVFNLINEGDSSSCLKI